MNILGIDFGLKRIGLAVCEDGWVRPLTVIENSSFLNQKVASFCHQYGVGKIVVGIPESKLVGEIHLFGDSLSQITHLPVIYHPETLTTKDAIAKMIEIGKRRKKRREKQDAYAAALILESYLAERR